MKKFIILTLALLLGFGLVASSFANESRTIPHKFKAFTADTALSQGITIFKVSGLATASNGVFGIYNTTSVGLADTTNVCFEGGEATSGDMITPVDFGPEGLSLDSGFTVIVDNFTLVVEYI